VTKAQIRRHLRAALELQAGSPGTETDHLWLLLPEGVPHDEALIAHATQIGCNGVVSPGPRGSALHREAEAAGLNTSVPVLFRPSPPPPGPPPIGDQLAFVAGWLAGAPPVRPGR